MEIENSKPITLDNIVAIEVELNGNQINTDIDLGSITLFNENKNFSFDIVQSYRSYNEISNMTEIRLEVEIDKETLSESNYLLTDLDLLKLETKGTIYLAMDNMELFNDAFLYAKVKFTDRKIRLLID